MRSALNSLSWVVLCLAPALADAFWSSKERVVTEVAQDHRDNHTALVPDVPVEYGVDVSFPMHYKDVSINYPWLPHNKDPTIKTPKMYDGMVLQPLGDRQKFYDDFLEGCVKAFGAKGDRCRQNEDDRVAMSLRQPQSMQNYTDMGFKKIRAPEPLWKLIKTFWDKNKNNKQPEMWGIGNTYTNNWESPTQMVSVEDVNLRGGGHTLKQQIWDAARDIIQDWTGEELTQCSLYGVRIYNTGAILAPHVDRLPLVSSAIINVDQDLDEPWPLEVIGHDGKAHNVSMEPGDMVLYESHSILHGRPFPLKGKFMANIFIHFEPTGHSLRHNARIALEQDKDVHEKYRDALKRGVAGHENDAGEDLPAYIRPGTPEESHWRLLHPNGRKSQRKSFTTGTTPAHFAAQKNDLSELQKVVAEKKDLVNARDQNGWTPLHEGVRFGHADVVKYLLENGADVNARTGENNGGSALWWAEQQLGKEHPVVELLRAAGAISMGPEL